MAEKIGKRHGRRVPPEGTPEHERWRANLVNGVREAKLRRRAAGMLTLTEVAVELALPVRAIKKMFPLIRAANRCYIWRSAIDRWKIETGGDADAA
jgi:hypothetical protein